jgi:hypothetical protein
VEVAEIGRLRTVVDVVRSDLCRLEGAVAECRRDNSKTLAEVLRRQEFLLRQDELTQSSTSSDHAAVCDPLQVALLEEFVLGRIEQERRARVEELSEVRKWAVELVHGCMQPPSYSGVGSRSSTGSRDSMQSPSSDGMGTRSKASALLDTPESTACSAPDVSNDVRSGVLAMKVQLSELQDEFARSQDRLSTLASRVTALEQGGGEREATAGLAASLEDEGAIAELLGRTRDCVGQLPKAVPPSAVSGSDRLFHAVTAMRQLREENAGLREENLKLGAVVGQSTPRLTAPRADAPPVPSRPPALPLGAPVADMVTGRNVSPPPGQRCLSSVADSPGARTVASYAPLPASASVAGSPVSAQAATPRRHATVLSYAFRSGRM